MIARRAKPLFTPSNIDDVHRRFQSIIRKAAAKADADAKRLRTPPKPSIFSLRTARQRKTA